MSDNFRFEITEHKAIPVGDIIHNPSNPRPDYHLLATDPNLLALGDSIKTTGQQRRAVVYECVDHYILPDAPGTYVLLQGARRHTACSITNVATLECDVVPTPKTEAEEQLWLGCEDAFRMQWGDLADFKHAKALADSMGVPITDPEVKNLTGLSGANLKDAERIFKLEPELIEAVEDYERALYHTPRDSSGRSKGRRAKSPVGEFTATKAAVIYDIFAQLRTNYTVSVKNLSDLELQLAIAKKKSSLAVYKRTLGALQDHSNNANAPGVAAFIADIFTDPTKKLDTLVESTDSQSVAKLKVALPKIDKLAKMARTVVATKNTLGSNVEFLRDLRSVLSQALLQFERLERQVDKKIIELERTEVE